MKTDVIKDCSQSKLKQFLNSVDQARPVSDWSLDRGECHHPTEQQLLSTELNWRTSALVNPPGPCYRAGNLTKRMHLTPSLRS